MKNQTSIVTTPVMTLCNRYCTLALWVGNPGQLVEVSRVSCHKFTVDKTASLIYEDRHKNSCGMHHAEEHEINHTPTWDWVQKWMERGMIAEGQMLPADSTYWKDLSVAK